MTSNRRPVAGGCRSCRGGPVRTVLDLGRQPVADDLLDDADAARAAPRHRLAVAVCAACGLVQLDPQTPVLPNARHGHGSAFSGTVQTHERAWAEELLALPRRGQARRVLDTGSGGGGLLRPFLASGWRVRGWERDGPLAAQATLTGVPTAVVEYGGAGPDDGAFDLVIANHTLSHADDLDASLSVLVGRLADGGTLAVEFHSAASMLTGGQFDVVCHAHRSYLSLTSLSTALARHGLTVTSARTLPLYGGVVRLLARPDGVPDGEVRRVLDEEGRCGTADPASWEALGRSAARTRDALRPLLDEQLDAGARLAAYGAPSRGVTLLNYCAVDADVVPVTADRSPAKQGRYLPGAGTVVRAPEHFDDDRPDTVLVLVWPLREEILTQLSDLRRLGTRFIFPLPRPELVA